MATIAEGQGMAKRRLQPGDVVRFIDPELVDVLGREGIVTRCGRDLIPGIRTGLDLIEGYFGEELISTAAESVELVKAVDPQLSFMASEVA